MFRFIASVALVLGVGACTGSDGLSDPSLAGQVIRAKDEAASACWTEVPAGAVPRQGWFRNVCPDDMTPAFTAEVQRALAARGYYAGPQDGKTSDGLGAAIERYQTDRGLPSAVLSYRGAQQLGLKPWLDKT